MGRVTELLGAERPQVCHLLLPSAHRPSSRLFLRVALDCSLWMLTSSITRSGKSLSWMRGSCTVWRTCVAVPSMSVVSGEGQMWGARKVTIGWVSWEGPGWVNCALQDSSSPLTHPVKAPVCLSHELGVMQPGQTVIELSADGVCHTSRCTDVLDPLTSFYQINITSVLCDMHCEAVGATWGGCGHEGWAGRSSAGCCLLQKASLESRHQSSLQRPPWIGAQLGRGGLFLWATRAKGLNYSLVSTNV